MTERQQLLESIATKSADYRAGDLAAPTAEHVDRWVKQFSTGVQLPILERNATNIEARFGIGDIPDFRALFTIIF